MNKEIKDRLDKLENELKESKNEIHSLKSSVSLTIERGIRKLLSRFTRKQLILGSVISLFLISIIGIAGTVTKTYTFSSGDVVSASKFNTNFDTLFTLVNGNLDDNNISSLSGSKITSGTVAAARIDNLDGSKITSGTVAAARIDNLSASMITSGVFNNSTIPKPADSIVFFSTPRVQGNLGGRSGADAICLNYLDNENISMFNNSCSNVRAVISIDANDEIRDMATNYNIPTNRDLRGSTGMLFGTSWDNFTNGSLLFKTHFAVFGILSNEFAWGGSTTNGSLSGEHCSNFSSSSGSSSGDTITFNSLTAIFQDTDNPCEHIMQVLCICY